MSPRRARRRGPAGRVIMAGETMASTPRMRLTAGLPPGLYRRPDEGVVAGVCAGTARWLGVDPIVVRLAALTLALANGAGIALYLVAWAVLPERRGDRPDPAAPPESGRRGAELALAVGCITVGLLVLLRWTLPFFPDGLVWPATIVAVGVALVLTRTGEAERARWREMAGRLPGNPVEALRGGWGLWLRIAVGAQLLIVGFATFLAANDAFSAVGQVGVAVLATALGVALVFGPWIVRLAVDLRDERRERIRTEERAEMAAHLHDSVLQTLALIQRHADEPQESRSLARRQERELRAWLYGDRRPSGGGADGAAPSLAAALDRMTDEVEADHRGVAVDVVLVGDCPVDPGVAALVQAVREAVVNAAKHSGESAVSVYVEVDRGRVEAFVRDRGRGFDPDAVDGDRRGITHSIVARMARHGGRAQVHSAPGDGTEVTIQVECQTEVAR